MWAVEVMVDICQEYGVEADGSWQRVRCIRAPQIHFDLLIW